MKKALKYTGLFSLFLGIFLIIFWLFLGLLGNGLDTSRWSDGARFSVGFLTMIFALGATAYSAGINGEIFD